MKTIGILALQGDFFEHHKAVRDVGLQAILVKEQKDLDRIDSLIIPGGESTSIGIIAERNNLVRPIKNFIKSDKPVWGTCAGLIMLANRISGQKRNGQISFGELDITVERNFFGRQINSFEKEITINTNPEIKQKVDFIRAPGIIEYAKNVQVLSEINYKNKQIPVAVRQNNILGTTFHSELSNKLDLLKYFSGF